MLSIGEFAGMTGLGVKALRHYDERGVLTPHEVDRPSGYRRYGEDQVRDGVVIRALRDAGVPLPRVAEVVAGADAGAALDTHRRAVLAEREREDAGFARAAAVLAALAPPVEVEERACAAQPYAARVLSVEPDCADDLDDDAANAQFAALFADLQRADAGPIGPFWTALRAGEHGRIDIACCWPTSRRLEAGWGDAGTTTAVLPARTELVATWRPQGDERLPEDATHPAVVALYDAVAARGLDLRAAEVRQRVLGDERDHCVEIAVTIA